MSNDIGDIEVASEVEGDRSLWVSLVCSFAVFAAVASSYKYIEPKQGACWKIHAIYWAVSICSVAFLPGGSYVFSELTVTLVGAVYPIYRSTKAVCTPDEEDDKEWLQFWIAGGVLFVLTTWVTDVAEGEKANTVWLGTLLFVFYWLYFPLTRGSMLVYDHITEPYLGPRVKPLQRGMSNAIVYTQQALSNIFHLYLVWIIFMFLPAGLKRIIAIAVGTVYPFVCSVTAAATEEIEDDTYWLTYWSVYGCLFLFMDLFEAWMGWIPGFYTLVLLVRGMPMDASCIAWVLKVSMFSSLVTRDTYFSFLHDFINNTSTVYRIFDVAYVPRG